jgi:secreted trypsin-like serine protease
VNCGKQNKPSVYTDVAQHRAWIEQIVQNLPEQILSTTPEEILSTTPEEILSTTPEEILHTTPDAAARNSMNYVTIAAMLATLASLWSCRT